MGLISFPNQDGVCWLPDLHILDLGDCAAEFEWCAPWTEQGRSYEAFLDRDR